MTSDSTATAINDSGHAGRLWRVNLHSGTAERFGDSLTNVDWEAISYDPAVRQYVVCDVGDNQRARNSVQVYRLDAGGKLLQSYALTYPDGAHDCEACLFRGDTLTLITKAQTLGGGKRRSAYVYKSVLGRRGEGMLRLADSFELVRRSVTDAAWLDGGKVALVAYDFQLIGPIPFTRTKVYVGRLDDLGADRYVSRRVRAPFTVTQYEAISRTSDKGGLLLASERTVIFPARWRRVSSPQSW